jgi:hypothetical protein
VVGKKLIQAFITLDRLPRFRGPKEPGGHWPRTITEWADQLAQAELEESERHARQEISNRVIIRPTASEIAQMEATIRAVATACHLSVGRFTRSNWSTKHNM